MRSKLYMGTIFRRSGYNSTIIDAEVYDTFDDALKDGKEVIKTDCYNNSDADLDTEDDYNNYLTSLKENDIDYSIYISIISTDRKRFNTSKELMNYFNNNIDNISNDNLYDFLLSLVESDDYVYDYNGNLLYHNIQYQSLLLEHVFSSDINFDIESCKEGKYTFKYHYREEE